MRIPISRVRCVTVLASTVDADGGEQLSTRSRTRHKRRLIPSSCQDFSDNGVEGLEVGNGLVGIDRRHDVADGWKDGLSLPRPRPDQERHAQAVASNEPGTLRRLLLCRADRDRNELGPPGKGGYDRDDTDDLAWPIVRTSSHCTRLPIGFSFGQIQTAIASLTTIPSGPAERRVRRTPSRAEIGTARSEELAGSTYSRVASVGTFFPSAAGEIPSTRMPMPGTIP